MNEHLAEGTAGRSALIACAVFAATAAFLWWIAGSRFLVIPDEGIYLDGALRMIRGEAPYRDFFVLTGPGTYWIQYLSLRFFGIQIWATRIPVIADVALLATFIYWLAARLSGRVTALAAALLYLALQANYFTVLQANHRWDSSMLALASLVLVFEVLGTSTPLTLFLAGFLSAAAAWATPTMGIVSATVLLWLALHPQRRSTLPAFSAGVVICLAAGALWLFHDGALMAMIEHFRWSAANYSSANRTPYGWAVGGYANILRGAGVSEAIARLVVLAFVTLPATLPPICLIGWSVRLRVRRAERCGFRQEIIFLMLCSTALLASTFPRPDLTHLMYVAPIFYVLGASLLAPLVSGRWTLLTLSMLGMAAASFLSVAVSLRLHEQDMDTIAGKIHGNRADLRVVEMVTSRVRRGDTLFVFPYAPIFYFLTDARNPTRYSFLQPGMFTREDEQAAVGALAAHPPRWVLYFSATPETYLRTWPSSDPQRLRMPSIEDFIQKNYRIVSSADRFELMEKRPTN
jgi:4-amino-4-deoxy-L-arabinose transferase-like glycosyltransferase